MNTNEGKVLAKGGWYSKRDCPDNPKTTGLYAHSHRLEDISSKPGNVKVGERLVTSKCRYCGGLVVDCPTISVM